MRDKGFICKVQERLGAKELNLVEIKEGEKEIKHQTYVHQFDEEKKILNDSICLLV